MKITTFAISITLAATLFVSGALAQTASVPTGSAVEAAPAPSCVAEKLSVDSLVGDLLDNPAAKAILIKHVPELKDNDQIDQARPMPLRSLQAYAEDTFTDKVLVDIDADLSTLPVCEKK